MSEQDSPATENEQTEREPTFREKKPSLGFFANRFFEFVKLSLLFVLFSLPLVTIPASFTAMVFVVLRYLNDRQVSLWEDFRGAFKSNFARSTLYGVISLGLGFGLWLCYDAGNQAGLSTPLHTALNIVYALSGLLLLIHALYFYPIQAWINLPFPAVLKNALLLPVVTYKATLKAIAILAVLAFFSWTMRPVSWILLAFLSAGCCYAVYAVCLDPIKKYLVQ